MNLYVSTGGSDSKDGLTEATALRNISTAAQRLNPLDECRVANGTYDEYLRSWSSGSNGGWITFVNYQGGDVIVRAPAGSEFVAFFSTASHSFLRFYGFTFDAANIDGAAVKVTSGSQFIDFHRSKFCNSGSSHGLQTSTGDVQPDTYVRCYDCDFFENGKRTYDGGTENHGYYNSSTRFNEFHRCRFWNNHSHGVHNYNGTPDNNIYDSCRAWGNPIGFGIYSGADNQVSNCEAFLNGIGFRADYDCERTLLAFNTGWKNGINFQIASVGVGTIVENCLSCGATGHGIEVYKRGQKVTVRNCLSEGNAGGDFFNENGAETIESDNRFGGQFKAAFINVASNNFALQAVSSARNAGRPVQGIVTDIVGIPRPQEGSPDIGAWEYNPGGAPPVEIPPVVVPPVVIPPVVVVPPPQPGAGPDNDIPPYSWFTNLEKSLAAARIDLDTAGRNIKDSRSELVAMAAQLREINSKLGIK